MNLFNRCYQKNVLLTFVMFMFTSSDCSALVSSSPSFQWVRTYRTNNTDVGRGLAVSNAGPVYLSGHTDTSFRPSRKDIFLGSFNTNGESNWIDTQVVDSGTTTFGISSDDSGNAYIATSINKEVAGPGLGDEDVLLKKYSQSGDLVWERQLGSQARDFGLSVEAGQLGEVFVTGYSLGELGDVSFNGWDGYIAKFDALGNRQWTRQFGTDLDDYGVALSVDHLGNAYVSGLTNGPLGSPNAGKGDVFVSKYDAQGDLVWTNQFGTPEEDVVINSVVDSSGNIFLTGITGGSLEGSNAGRDDAFISMVGANGELNWVRQLGTNERDEGSGITISKAGIVYVGGMTQGELGGENFGSRDAFLASYTKQGDLLNIQQFGSSSADAIWGVEADGMGHLYISGSSHGGLGVNSQVFDDGDAFLAKILIPEPASFTLVLVALTLAPLLTRRRPR